MGDTRSIQQVFLFSSCIEVNARAEIEYLLSGADEAGTVPRVSH